MPSCMSPADQNYDERFTRVRADVLSEALEWILAEELEK